MTDTSQYRISGASAADVVRSVERGVTSGVLGPATVVPSVRGLARDLGLSPTTVATAYRELRRRGVLVSHDRSRTVVGHRPPLGDRLAPTIPDGTVDLASGDPDPRLLPDLAPGLAGLDPDPRMYGREPGHRPLLDRAREALVDDGVAADHLAVVGGALDGIERVLGVHLRVGDPVAVEDPGYTGVIDLVRAMGFAPVPVAVDDDGPSPAAMSVTLARGVQAVVVVPRAQNPTGAAVTADRAAALREVLAAHPQVLVVEDDHAAAIAGAPLHTLTDPRRERWAAVRSTAKALGPDLRVAVVAGDEDTVARVLGRQRLGTGWVSHILQQLAAVTWTDALAAGTVATATRTYTARRTALIEALASHGIPAHGRSGLNVWVPVPEETPVVQGLAARGWAVLPGEPFRIEAPPAIRITVSALPDERAAELADDLAAVLGQRLPTRRG